MPKITSAHEVELNKIKRSISNCQAEIEDRQRWVAVLDKFLGNVGTLKNLKKKYQDIVNVRTHEMEQAQAKLEELKTKYELEDAELFKTPKQKQDELNQALQKRIAVLEKALSEIKPDAE